VHGRHWSACGAGDILGVSPSGGGVIGSDWRLWRRALSRFFFAFPAAVW